MRERFLRRLVCLYLFFQSGIVKGVAVMAQISLRVDDDVKRGAEQALSDNWIKHVCRCQYFFT